MKIVINILLTIHVMVSLFIIFFVLMQRPKSEGLGAAFGGGMTENLFGAGATNALQTITRWLGGIFFGLTLLLSILYIKQTHVKSPNENRLTAPTNIPKDAATPAPTTPSVTPASTPAAPGASAAPKPEATAPQAGTAPTAPAKPDSSAPSGTATPDSSSASKTEAPAPAKPESAVPAAPAPPAPVPPAAPSSAAPQPAPAR